MAQSVLMVIPSYFMQSMMIPKGLCEEIERMVRKFIWGSSNGEKKLALVSWDNICQPRDHGVVSFQKLQDHNTSFIMKLSYSVVTDSKAL